MLRTLTLRRLLPATILGLILLFPKLGAVPIINGDEARFAQAAREMRERSDWVLPSFGAQPRYDKPILIYWLTMLSYSTFGETSFAARFPSALATLAAALLLGAFARAKWNPKKGFEGALLFLASPLIFLEAHASTADSLNNLWILAAMLCLLEILQGNRNPAVQAALWVSIALGMLSKGPVILLVIGGSLAGMQALRRRWRSWEILLSSLLLLAAAAGAGPLLLLPPLLLLGFEFLRQEWPEGEGRDSLFRGRHLLWGPLLLLSLVLPWALAAHRASGGEFFRVALGRHVIGRSLSTLEHHQGFPGIYILAFFILAFPWAAQLPGSIHRFWARRRESTEILFLLGWLLGPLLLFEGLKTRLVHYEMPLYAAGILLLLADDTRRVSRGLLFSGGILLAAIPLIPALYFDLGELMLPALSLAVLLLLPLVGLIFKPDSTILRQSLHGATALFLLALFGLYLPHFSRFFIGPRTLEAAHRLALPGEDFVIYKLRDEDLLFGLPVGTRVLRSEAELAEFLSRAHQGLLITREKDWALDGQKLARRPLEPDARIRGLDLGRGKWTTTLCFRLRSIGPPGADS